MVRGEDPHAVQRRGRAFRRGQASPDHLVLPQLEAEERQTARSVSTPAPPAQPPRNHPRPSLISPRHGPTPWKAQRWEQANPGEGEEKETTSAERSPRRPSCAARRSRPPPRGGAASSRVLQERRRRHVGRLPPSRPRQGRLGARGPLSSAASPRRRPPNGRSGLGRKLQSRPCVPAPRSPLTVPDAFMVLPPPRPAGKERPRAPPPPVTRPPAAPPPAVLSAHWLGGERDWRRQPSVSTRGGRRWVPGRRGPRVRRGPAWARPAAEAQPALRSGASGAAALLRITVAADPHGPGRASPGRA